MLKNNIYFIKKMDQSRKEMKMFLGINYYTNITYSKNAC
jgi:hypothetical protein